MCKLLQGGYDGKAHHVVLNQYSQVTFFWGLFFFRETSKDNFFSLRKYVTAAKIRWPIQVQ